MMGAGVGGCFRGLGPVTGFLGGSCRTQLFGAQVPSHGPARSVGGLAAFPRKAHGRSCPLWK